MQGGEFSKYVRRCWFGVLGDRGRFADRARAIVGPRMLRRGRMAYSVWFTSVVGSLFDPSFLSCSRAPVNSQARGYESSGSLGEGVAGARRVASGFFRFGD